MNRMSSSKCATITSVSAGSTGAGGSVTLSPQPAVPSASRATAAGATVPRVMRRPHGPRVEHLGPPYQAGDRHALVVAVEHVGEPDPGVALDLDRREPVPARPDL